MTSSNDSQKNLNMVLKAINKLPSDTRLFCLPENSLYINLNNEPILFEQALHKGSPVIEVLQEKAKEKNLYIHCGGLPWQKDSQVYNEALLITPQGDLIETYEKLHLFDVDFGGGVQATESLSYKRGQRFGTFEVDGWKIATCICYDLRFPELFLQYMKTENVDVFLVPAAFTTKTGKLHWKPLLQARAIECQSYILAPAQVGYHRDGDKLRKSWGQTLAISPWGKIIEESASFEAFLDSCLTDHEPINSVLDRKEIDGYRTSIPIQQHRRIKMELEIQ